MWQINKAVSEHKKLVETSSRLQRMLPDKEAFVDNLTKARQAAHEVRRINYEQLSSLCVYKYFHQFLTVYEGQIME